MTFLSSLVQPDFSLNGTTGRNTSLASRKGLCRLLVIIGLLLGSPASWAQTTLTINSVGDGADNNPGNGVCFTGVLIPIAGFLEAECTLRAAIQEANESSGEVVINFSSGIFVDANGFSMTIPQSPLPEITNRITIAGETHPLYDNNFGLHGFIINGEQAGSSSGLRLLSGASGSSIRGIAIGGFSLVGISVVGGSNYRIQNNLIGGWVNYRSGIFSVRFNGNGNHGLLLVSASASGSPSIISDNMIMANGGDGITLGFQTAHAIVVANKIGILPKLPQGIYRVLPESRNQGTGIRIASNAGTGNIVGSFFSEPNFVANSGNGGIRVEADGQTISGNHIGVPVNGLHPDDNLADFGNRSNGVIVESSNNVIGGSGALSNIIGNSEFVGIRIGNGGAANIAANNNLVRHNLIGVMPTGEAVGQSQGVRIDRGSGNTIIGAVIANNITGIEFRDGPNAASRNTIVNQSGAGVWFRAVGSLGGSSLQDANVIGNNLRGVDVSSTAGGLVTIRNNYIGTNADGDNLGHAGPGILVNGNNSVDIGGTNQGNVIGNNGSGIALQTASEVWIMGNRIGIHANGQSIPNGTGILIGAPNLVTTDTRIGYLATQDLPQDPLSGAGNIIAFNLEHGINMNAFSGATQLNNSIRGNSIYGNGGQGIYLGPNGSTVDEGGASTGPNRLQNFPVFDDQATFYDGNSKALNFRYQVRTLAVNASYPLRIDFYLAASGSNQGRIYLGTHVYETSDSMGFVVDTLSPPAGTPMFGNLTATATDAVGNSSQFSSGPVFLGEQQDSIFSDRFRD